MKQILNKQGFSLAEALVAMLLVAVMAAGVITALMSTKRAIIAPSNKEDMVFAIEKAASLLQMADSNDTISSIFGSYDPQCDKGCCSSNLALSDTPDCSRESLNSCHNIDCLLPASCQAEGDSFRYQVSEWKEDPNDTKKQIVFIITCAGESI